MTCQGERRVLVPATYPPQAGSTSSLFGPAIDITSQQMESAGRVHADRKGCADHPSVRFQQRTDCWQRQWQRWRRQPRRWRQRRQAQHQLAGPCTAHVPAATVSERLPARHMARCSGTSCVAMHKIARILAADRSPPAAHGKSSTEPGMQWIRLPSVQAVRMHCSTPGTFAELLVPRVRSTKR